MNAQSPESGTWSYIITITSNHITKGHLIAETVSWFIRIDILFYQCTCTYGWIGSSRMMCPTQRKKGRKRDESVVVSSLCSTFSLDPLCHVAVSVSYDLEKGSDQSLARSLLQELLTIQIIPVWTPPRWKSRREKRGCRFQSYGRWPLRAFTLLMLVVVVVVMMLLLLLLPIHGYRDIVLGQLWVDTFNMPRNQIVHSHSQFDLPVLHFHRRFVFVRKSCAWFCRRRRIEYWGRRRRGRRRRGGWCSLSNAVQLAVSKGLEIGAFVFSVGIPLSYSNEEQSEKEEWWWWRKGSRCVCLTLEFFIHVT
jgi:hypothetical protein